MSLHQKCSCKRPFLHVPALSVVQHSVRAVSNDFLQWRMASRTSTSALPWHQYSAAPDEEALDDVDRRAGVVASALEDRGAENTRPGTGTGSRRSALALRHSGTRKRRYLSRILRVASSGLLAPPAPAPGRRDREAEMITDAGVLCAVWNAAGDEHPDDAASAYDDPPITSRTPPSQGR